MATQHPSKASQPLRGSQIGSLAWNSNQLAGTHTGTLLAKAYGHQICHPDARVLPGKRKTLPLQSQLTPLLCGHRWFNLPVHCAHVDLH